MVVTGGFVCVFVLRIYFRFLIVLKWQIVFNAGGWLAGSAAALTTTLNGLGYTPKNFVIAATVSRTPWHITYSVPGTN
jgi:hypothetical protein